MKEELLKIKKEVNSLIEKAQNEQELLKIKADTLGKKSKLNHILKEIKNLSINEKREIGKLSNEIKNSLEKSIKEKIKLYENRGNKILFDVTKPIEENTGSLNPITIVSNEVTEVLKKWASL